MHMRPELPQTRCLKGSQPRALKTRFRTKESTPITGTPQPNAAAEVIKERHAASGRVPRRGPCATGLPAPAGLAVVNELGTWGRWGAANAPASGVGPLQSREFRVFTPAPLPAPPARGLGPQR